MSEGSPPRSGQNSQFRNQFKCYSQRRCDRPDRSHMSRPLTAPWGVQGSIVEETVGGPETCTNDFQYEIYPWTGVCAYLEIYNPGIYTFATPCKCGTLTDAPADLNERVCIWQGERCGGNVVGRAASPPPPSLSPFPPNTIVYHPPPPSPFPPGMAPPPSPEQAISGGGVAAIVLGVVGCASMIAACIAYARGARPRVPRLASLPALPPKPAQLPTLSLGTPVSQ